MNVNTGKLRVLLKKLREQAAGQGTDALGYHQLGAHWSIAFMCEEAALAWEMYRAATLAMLPCTKFFRGHQSENEKALTPHATWTLLRDHAIPNLELQAAMTDDECKLHGCPGRVQYYDSLSATWKSVDVPSVRWFDGRDLIKAHLADTQADVDRRIADTLYRHEAAATGEPTRAKIERLEKYRRFVSTQAIENRKTFDKRKRDAAHWLAKLERYPDFSKILFRILRSAENEVRKSMGVGLVGESWVSETELYYRVKKLFPEVESTQHGKLSWLGRQHLDIWLPDLQVAIEYHGEQHFRSIDFFGGEAAFEKVRERDARKRALCAQNGVRLIEIAYDADVTDDALRSMINGTCLP
ncbi:hypothetical protein GALL_331780 [mine drainage metagenome]|uniref:Uncharacterized protein n=1 Tax=mine drainage metagenome TaxID=410659 RepID=A0A1J5QN34_9ZZZZ